MSQEKNTRLLAADAAGISEAAEILRAGGLVAFPTETVYGLGADATDARAVAGIYRAKGRPSFNPLIAHVADVALARREGRFDGRAEKLAEAFWPGPLTLVLPLSEAAQTCDLARAGLDSIGLRLPAHPVAQKLLAAAGRPVAAPSANLSGHVSPATPAHVLADLNGRIDALLDGGACPVGVELTIVALLDETPRLLRPGGVSRSALEQVLGCTLEGDDTDSGKPLAPGMLASHYAPRAKFGSMRKIARGRGRAGFRRPIFWRDQDMIYLRAKISTRRRPSFSPIYARSTQGGAKKIAVAPIPEVDLGEAINDRLRRAAAPRG